MRWAAPVGAVLLGVAAVCLAGAVPGSRGAGVQRSAGAEEMVTRVITYTYDPLYCLTGAAYSTGERYEYAYDAVGNRTVYTGTTPPVKSNDNVTEREWFCQKIMLPGGGRGRTDLKAL